MPKAKPTLTIHMVLDSSGSMAWCKKETEKAFNDYVATVAKDAPKSRVSLTVFGGSVIDTVIDDVQVKNVKLANYHPDGGTPLYDAIGHAVGKLDDKTGQKVLVILTDGEENTSTKFTAADIKTMLDDRQDVEDWLVIYLGANQDAFKEGAKFGARGGTTMTYNTSNMGETMLVASASTLRYASTGSLNNAAFTDDEREKAVK